MTYLDPQKRTYTVQKMAHLSKCGFPALLKELTQTTDVSSFKGEKSHKGTFMNFKTITTTVTKAEKDAKFSDAVLNLPQGYREVKMKMHQKRHR